jgi:hypothetical protein
MYEMKRVNTVSSIEIVILSFLIEGVSYFTKSKIILVAIEGVPVLLLYGADF